MVKYFGQHSYKQLICRKQSRFGYNICLNMKHDHLVNFELIKAEVQNLKMSMKTYC